MPITSVSPLYPIFDNQFLPENPNLRSALLKSTLKDFAALGITLAQLRWKAASEGQIRECAEAIRNARIGPLQCVLNDDPRLACELGFAGVHLGQRDVPVAEARPLLQPEAIIGLSTHSAAQVSSADQTGADYIAIGPVFATSTKFDAEPVIGLEGVRAARALTRKPLVAIGGITLENAVSVREAGADSLAVISALFGHPEHSPAKLAEDFLRRLR